MIRIFKGFFVRATKICSEKYLRAEIECLTDIFCENGHDGKTLLKIINSSEKKTCSTNNNNNNNNNTNKKQTITFPWVPKFGPKIKREIQKFGFRVAFQAGPNLNNILCKNKDNLVPNSHLGAYELKCSCRSVCNCEKRRKSLVHQ